METFKVKILETRKRLGIKEISAPSIENAEKYIVELLYDFMNIDQNKVKEDSRNLVYVVRNKNERFLKLFLNASKFSIHIQK